MPEQSGDLPEEKELLVEVQDAAREQMLRTLFGLVPAGEGRSGPDALDEAGHRFELKTTTKNSVSTARDVGPHTLEKWQERYWICARGRNLARGFEISEVYFLPPEALSNWLLPMRKQFESDLNLLKRASETLMQQNYTPAEIKRLSYLLRRGFTINNPHIPWKYIQAHGILITDNYAARLRQLMQQYPPISAAQE
jgi:hypothetical protein